VDEMRSMLVSDSESLSEHLCLLVHLDGFLRFLRIDIALLSFSIVSSFKIELSLVHEYLVDALWVELSCHLKGWMPILLVFIHIDSFLGLVSFDEFFLCLFKSVLILKMKSKLKMDFRKLVFSVWVGQSKCLLEFLLVSFEVDCCFN
jgi:hypothetical protein